MEFQQYLHNKGQQDILKDELIKELNSKIKSLEEIVDINVNLVKCNEDIIKQQEKVIKIQEEQYEALKDLAMKQPTFWENALFKYPWRNK